MLWCCALQVAYDIACMLARVVRQHSVAIDRVLRRFAWLLSDFGLQTSLSCVFLVSPRFSALPCAVLQLHQCAVSSGSEEGEQARAVRARVDRMHAPG